MTGNGYFAHGNFTGTNIWAKGQLDAPFDQEVYLRNTSLTFNQVNAFLFYQFHFIIDTAVGGTTGYFSDSLRGKPWRNSGPYALRDFWNRRIEWLPTWDLDGDSMDAAFQVDYIRAWAV